MKELPKESLKNKTYKGVPLQSHHDIGVELITQTVTDVCAKETAKAINDATIVHMQRVVRDVTINEGKLRRWVAMCQFLEESATLDDKTVIGQWLKAVNLQEQNDKLRAENKKIKEKMEALHKAVEGFLYD